MDLNIADIAKDNIRVNSLLSASVNELMKECENLMLENKKMLNDSNNQTQKSISGINSIITDSMEKIIKSSNLRMNQLSDNLDKMKRELSDLQKKNTVNQEEHYRNLIDKMQSMIKSLSAQTQVITTVNSSVNTGMEMIIEDLNEKSTGLINKINTEMIKVNNNMAQLQEMENKNNDMLIAYQEALNYLRKENKYTFLLSIGLGTISIILSIVIILML